MATDNLTWGALKIADSDTLDATWLSSVMGRPVESARVHGLSKLGGMSASFKAVDVTFEGGAQTTLALKTSAGSPIHAALGTAREAFFYNELAAGVRDAGVPRSFYAHGDLATGRMAILMERFEDHVPAGVFFGRSNPNNWNLGEDVHAALCAGNPSAEEAAAAAFLLYAKLHAPHWRSTKLCSNAWLRGADWVRGSGEESWAAAQKIATDAWASLTAARKTESSAIVWDPHLVACLDASFAKISWADFQEEAASRPFTLVHGDCHPHNNCWVDQRTERARLCLIDFEMVGVGSAAQDLGQYMISHMPAEARRKCERDLVRKYHDALCAELRAHGHGADAGEFSFEVCWREYVAGGAGRWQWFVPVLANMMDVRSAQFFHDQLAAFLHDHVPDATGVSMPRV